MTDSAAASPNRSRTRAVLELLRLPNVFTAIADVLLGFLFVHGSLEPGHLAGLLVVASALLYLSGMVLNDVFDREVDAAQRPERPIPSGRITLAHASRLGWALLASGVLAACIVSFMVGGVRAGIVALLLAALIVAYDAVLKKTLLGPIAMGGCRTLNVLLGMSATLEPWPVAAWILAAGLGVYVTGVTAFARTEAVRSKRPQLILGSVLMLLGILVVAAYPRWMPDAWALPYRDFEDRWALFWIVIALLIGVRLARAIIDPRPATVQLAVKNAILSIIVIDAGAALAVAGSFWATALVLLLLPAMALGRWIYST